MNASCRAAEVRTRGGEPMKRKGDYQEKAQRESERDECKTYTAQRLHIGVHDHGCGSREECTQCGVVKASKGLHDVHTHTHTHTDRYGIQRH